MQRCQNQYQQSSLSSNLIPPCCHFYPMCPCCKYMKCHVWCVLFKNINVTYECVSLMYFLRKVRRKLPQNYVISLQFVRKRFGKPFGSSWTESRAQRSTEPGFISASMKTSAWTTWPRTLAALRSIGTWWPEWVQHNQIPSLTTFFDNMFHTARLFSCQSSV